MIIREKDESKGSGRIPGMKDQSYRVVLEGTVREGFERGDVVKRLAAIFKKDAHLIEKLLTGTPRQIRGGLSFEAAAKYKKVLDKAGAATRIEPEEAGPLAPLHETPPREEAPEDSRPISAKERPTSAHAAAAVVCPKCGYSPTSANDVLLTRGDCPRCGLRVRKDLETAETEPGEDLSVRARRRPEVIYFDRTPASWDRRAVAGIHTFGLFLAVYTGLVFLFILTFVPLESLPSHLGTKFLDTVFQDFPVFLLSTAIVIVTCVVPIFNKGLSWGQRLAEIEVLYTKEAQIGGLYMTLIFRTIVALALTFLPGWLILWLGSLLGWFYASWSIATAMIVGGCIAWIASWIYAWGRQDMRSLFDLATGTLQVEEGLLPADAFGKACRLLLAVAGVWVLFGGIVPLLIKRLT
jgi:hypothetical protein